MKTKRIITIIFFIVATMKTFVGQDLQLSQYDAAPIILNPALTGIKENLKYRFVQQYRNQWDAIARKSFISTILAYDMNINQKWGAGAYILNDNSSRVYNSFSLVLSGAHDITIGNQDKHRLLVGLQSGFILKSLRLNQYTFDKQYYQGTFDPDLPNGESFEKSKRFLPEINFGFGYLNTDDASKFNPYSGISVWHCTNPKNNFLSEGEVSRLPLKYILYGGSIIKINEEFIIDTKIITLKQANIWQFTPTILIHYLQEQSDMHLIGGISFRIKDAIITQVGLQYRNFIYRISYDFNVSSLKTYSQYKGGVEFSITFFKNNNNSTRMKFI
jgi:type IX secretion system PorP/SprF family membrane protein